MLRYKIEAKSGKAKNKPSEVKIHYSVEAEDDLVFRSLLKIPTAIPDTKMVSYIFTEFLMEKMGITEEQIQKAIAEAQETLKKADQEWEKQNKPAEEPKPAEPKAGKQK